MTGGSARLMRKKWPLADEEILSFPLQYVNGVEIALTVDKVAAEPSSFEPMKMFSKLAGSFIQ